MIEIKINKSGNVKSVSLEGHADYAEHGSDIVCASVSTIFEVMTMGLILLAEQYPENIKIKEIS